MEEILKLENVQIHFPINKGIFFKKQVATVRAVDGVSFSVKKGETLGIVGESGCGKSTTGLGIMQMQSLTGGKIYFEGEEVKKERIKDFRKKVQMVYQDPYGSLNPRMKVKDLIGEPLKIHGLASDKNKYEKRIADLLKMVGLLPDMAERYPHEFSGGQRQRIGIARALALEPSLIVCDEPVSALDVSIQAQVINIFKDLQRRLGLTYIFIAHDLAVVRHISDRIVVMYLGQVMEIADRNDLYGAPKHPYTQALLSAVPEADIDLEHSRKRIVLKGEIPSPLNIPTGCRFHTRCPSATDVCKVKVPEMRDSGKEHYVACHLYD